MILKLSDLFQKRGHSFDWAQRIEDQKNLILRLREYSELTSYADELQEFCDQGIASSTYLDYVLQAITKACAEKNISID